MIEYLLDTNLIIDIFNDNKKIISIVEKLAQEGRLVTTLFNFIEVYFGAFAKKQEEATLKLLEKFQTFSLSQKSSMLFVQLKHKYLKKGQILSDFDLLIASIAIENDLTIITTDKDFKQIEELNKIILSP